MISIKNCPEMSFRDKSNNLQNVFLNLCTIFAFVKGFEKIFTNDFYVVSSWLGITNTGAGLDPNEAISPNVLQNLYHLLFIPFNAEFKTIVIKLFKI